MSLEQVPFLTTGYTFEACVLAGPSDLGVWLATVKELKSHPGYWQVEVCDGYSVLYSKRGVNAKYVALVLKHLGFPMEPSPAWKAILCDGWESPREERREPKQKQDIYFLQGVGGGLIKIGKAFDPRERRSQIQLMSPVELRILAIISDAGEHEGELHRRFAHVHSHGEWFRPEEDLLTFIRENAEIV